MISIIIPSLNESQNLPNIFRDLSEMPEAEIIVVDSSSEDKTEHVALIYGAKFYNLKLKNRGSQLNFGARQSKGEWLLFIHADSRLEKNWSEEIKKIIKNDSRYIYFFRFKINNKDFVYRILEYMVNLRCLFFKTPYGDQGVLINKNNFFLQKGYNEIPLMEDVDFIKRIDKKFLIPLKTLLYTSSRKWEGKNIIVQSIRNWRFRRRWLNGDSINSIYSDYYEMKD